MSLSRSAHWALTDAASPNTTTCPCVTFACFLLFDSTSGTRPHSSRRTTNPTRSTCYCYLISRCIPLSESSPLMPPPTPSTSLPFVYTSFATITYRIRMYRSPTSTWQWDRSSTPSARSAASALAPNTSLITRCYLYYNVCEHSDRLVNSVVAMWVSCFLLLWVWWPIISY